MKTAAQGEKGWPVGMEALTTTGAADNTGEDNRDNKQSNPDAKNNGRAIPVIGRIKGDHHRWQVGTDNRPQKPTAFADFF